MPVSSSRVFFAVSRCHTLTFSKNRLADPTKASSAIAQKLLQGSPPVRLSLLFLHSVFILNILVLRILPSFTCCFPIPLSPHSFMVVSLISGWTLLGETCPVEGCLVPLMLDPKTAVKVYAHPVVLSASRLHLTISFLMLNPQHCVNSEVCGYCDEQFGPPLSFQVCQG